MAYDKSLPTPTLVDEPFWRAAREHRLVLPRCAHCAHVWFPPYRTCPRCQSPDIDWVQASGRGTVFGVAVFERQYLKAFPTPYHVALVQLEEGPMLYGTVVDTPDDEVVAGLEVAVVFDDVTPEITLPRFRRR